MSTRENNERTMANIAEAISNIQTDPTPADLCDVMGYPLDGADVMDESIEFKAATIAAVMKFREKKTMKARQNDRIDALTELLNDLMAIYGMTGWTIAYNPAASSASVSGKKITLRGRSLVDALHEFRHAMQFDGIVRLRRDTPKEWDACRWSLNLFKKCCPQSFEKCEFKGHLLVRKRGQELGAPIEGASREITA